MREVVFRNTRFDPEHHAFDRLATPLVNAVGYTAELSIDVQLAQLMRLRVAQTNMCAFCLILHSQSARDRDIPQAKIDDLPAYEASALYSEAEKTALRYCDAFVGPNVAGFQALHEQMTAHYSLQQIADCAAVVINMHLWTRWKLAHGQTPYFAE